MSFTSWGEFFHMGGYALYVWASFGLTAVVLGWVMLAPWVEYRALRRAARRQQRRTTRPGAGA